MISVIIPLYNKRETVARALRSVFTQTVEDFEVIVVDDGSNDGSAEIVKSFADPRIRIITQPNSGVSAARNRGVSESRSNLVALLDGDDEWLPTFLEAIIALRAKFPECGIYCTSYYVQGADGGRSERLLSACDCSARQVKIDDYFSIASRSAPPVWSSAVALLREDLFAVGGFPVGVESGEDLLTWARLTATKQVAMHTAPLAIYHQDPTTTSGSPSRTPDPADRVGRGLREILSSMPRDRRRSMRKYVGLWYKMRSSIYLRLGNRLRGILECSKAIRFWPSNTVLYLQLFSCLLPMKVVRWLCVKRGFK